MYHITRKTSKELVVELDKKSIVLNLVLSLFLSLIIGYLMMSESFLSSPFLKYIIVFTLASLVYQAVKFMKGDQLYFDKSSNVLKRNGKVIQKLEKLSRVNFETIKREESKSDYNIIIEYIEEEWLTVTISSHIERNRMLAKEIAAFLEVPFRNVDEKEFAGNEKGAAQIAMFYSFFATAKMHDIEPYQWLKNTLEVIDDYPINKLEELLPVK